MSCDSIQFVISKGVDNTFVFTIKQNNSTLPMQIEVGDTFYADLVSLETGIAIIENKPLTVIDALNGKVELALTEAEVAPLVSERGSKVDRYYLRPTYKLVLNCSTANNGDFIAKVSEVYVD